jgi:uncharacterized protein (DUF736 family)
MAIIGTFTKSGDGYTGSLKTVMLSVKAKIAPAEKENDKAPDFRIFAGQTEFGAAWKRTSNAGREYLSVKLDDPSFPAPVFASLVETENDGLVLIWSRRTADGGAPNSPPSSGWAASVIVRSVLPLLPQRRHTQRIASYLPRRLLCEIPRYPWSRAIQRSIGAYRECNALTGALE